MPFEAQWLRLDQLLKLLGLSPDDPRVESIVRPRFRSALEEGAIWDREYTDKDEWRWRFKTGVVINWTTGAMIVPYYHHRLREVRFRVDEWLFHRAAWLRIFDDLIPIASTLTATDATGAALHGAVAEIDAPVAPESADVPQERPGKEIAQEVTCWFQDDFATKHPSRVSGKPPEEDEVMSAAKRRFRGIKVKELQELVRAARRDRRTPSHWKTPGPKRGA
jgi:hypothetical protein